MTAADVTHGAHDLPTDECPEAICSGVLMVVEARDVTEEIVDYVVEVADSNYGDSPIDWETMFDDRVDGMTLADGRRVNLGPEYDSPAMRKIQRQVRKARAAG